MAFGRGLAASAISDQLERNDERHRREAAEKRLEKREERADTTFRQQQQDRAFGLPFQRRAIERQDELAGYEAELKRQQMEIARIIHGARVKGASQEAMAALAAAEDKAYGAIWKAYRARGGEAAARLLRTMPGSENATDFVETGDGKVNVVDDQGRVLFEIDAELSDRLYGITPEQEFVESERGILNKRTGEFRPHGAGVPGSAGSKVDPREKELRQIVYPQWGSQLGDRFVFDGRNGEYANEHLRLAIELMDKAGEKGTRNLARYAEEAGRIIRERKAREEFRGKLSTDLIGFNAEEAAKKIQQLFPSGASEQELRDFMAKHDVQDKSKQDQVLRIIGVRSGAREQPRQQATSKLPPGVTKEQALAQAKQVWGRANAQQRAQIRERLMGWGITEKEIRAAGM